MTRLDTRASMTFQQVHIRINDAATGKPTQELFPKAAAFKAILEKAGAKHQ